MEATTDHHRRRLRIVAVTIGLAVVLLVGVGVYGLLRGPSTPTNPTPPPVTDTPTVVPRDQTGPAAVRQTDNPEGFARTIALTLFSWDSTSGYGPSDYAQVLADVAAGAEADALADDVRAYLPGPQAWAQLRQYQTRQWLSIDAITVPDDWQTALRQAAPGQIPRGTRAYTITGTRHRTGTWNTTPLETTRAVAFTVFVRCPTQPPGDAGATQCELLRLSQLDNPLK